MIDSALLLSDLKARVVVLTDDLRVQADAGGAVADFVRTEHAAAKAAQRTAQSETAWREDLLVQGAVAWVLSSVFVRFMEDCGLVEEAWLSGPGARRDEARARRQGYFAEHPLASERDVLHAAFERAAAAPAAAALFDQSHNLLWKLPISGDAARELLGFWDRLDDGADDVRLRHDFSDPERDTRFLGDLYQDVSDAARDKYALLQTPDFIESFILDRTMEPALAEFGLADFKLIDPTCGSGHFLIGAFRRLLDRWRDEEPGTPLPELTARALRSVHGVDVNPYAVAIARFRLTVEAMQACSIRRIADAPGWDVRVACGDSLLHGPEEGQFADATFRAGLVRKGLHHHYLTEDADRLSEWLRPGYHAVVGNPPYITVKDAALNAAYRTRYPTCKGKYGLTVPFMERFFDLGRTADGRGGFVGQITGNAFMKREFGTKLVEDFLPTVDVQTIIDTAGAYIPGHGTPTVIIVGRSRRPVLSTVRAVMGIRGEPSPPADPAHGLVWKSIVEQVDEAGSENAFVSVDDTPRTVLAHHPWSITGGGAGDLRHRVEAARRPLENAVLVVGIQSLTGEDDVFSGARSLTYHRGGVAALIKPLVAGDEVRDWQAQGELAVFPYLFDQSAAPEETLATFLWPWRETLRRRVFFGQSQIARGRLWTEWTVHHAGRAAIPLTITWGEVATHNHFVLDRGGKVFKQTAPVIKLPEGATEDEHLALLGVLNSSVACFWLKQVCHNKGSTVDSRGARQRTAEFEDFFQLNGTKVKQLPLPHNLNADIAHSIDELAGRRAARLASVEALLTDGDADLLAAAEDDTADLRAMVSLQEELDWQALAAYELTSDDLSFGEAAPPLSLGERAFEIVLARQVAAGQAETTWFVRHGSTPITELPEHWPADYRAVVERRVDLISSDRDIRLIERPENKRRWNRPPWAERERIAMRTYLLDRVEQLDAWRSGELLTVAQVAQLLRGDARVELAAQRYAGSVDVDLERTLQTLIEEESVPYVAARRYTEAGLRVRAEWEATWALQRREDAGEVVDVPVPPKYGDKDWRNPRFKQLRGKLDVPKERFISVADGQRTGDPSPLIGWAGWDHADRAFALASRVNFVREQDGAGPERLVPLLAGLLELVPWVAQWHPEPDPETGQPPAVELEAFLSTERQRLGVTDDDLRAWRPPATQRGRRKKANA